MSSDFLRECRYIQKKKSKKKISDYENFVKFYFYIREISFKTQIYDGKLFFCILLRIYNGIFGFRMDLETSNKVFNSEKQTKMGKP